MRKSALTLKSNKVYNPNNLEVTGEKITLSNPDKPKPTTRTTRKTLKVAETDSIPKSCQFQKSPTKTHEERTVFKPSVREYKNTDISNKVLKQIRETTKVEDFERILQSLCQNDNFLNSKRRNKPDKVLESLEAENLYEEFFGKHFDYLLSIVNKARNEEGMKES